MNNVIWKYIIPPTIGCFSIEMPVGAKILTLQLQDGTPYMWALINKFNIGQETTRRFHLCWTGIEFENEGLTYIGTYQLGEFVFHLFEKE